MPASVSQPRAHNRNRRRRRGRKSAGSK
jgi:hypothetical protein